MIEKSQTVANYEWNATNVTLETAQSGLEPPAYRLNNRGNRSDVEFICSIEIQFYFPLYSGNILPSVLRFA